MKQKLIEWLKKEVEGGQLLWFLAFCLIILLNYTMLAAIVATTIFKIKVSSSANPSIIRHVFFASFALTAFEELFFRAPLALAAKIWTANFQRVIWLAIAYSAIFALAHTGGMTTFFFQGVGGLILSVIFLKCGGSQSKFIKPFTCSTLVHAFFNISIVILI